MLKVNWDLMFQNNMMIMLVLRLMVYHYGLDGNVLKDYRNHYYID